jgi:hypothetical protein
MPILTPEPDFEIPVGDLVPIIEIELRGADGKALLLPAGSSAKLRMWLDGSYVTPKVNANMTIVSQRLVPEDLTTKTVVKYAWQGTDTNTPELYFARVKGTLNTGEPFSVPNGIGEYIRILVSQPT